ncbi:FCD domain-containing protein [Pseudodesulfovibrio sp. JC047]|uniref:FadR/GntR family transcriptional regulator n=1 Tax=Pseudodesulfovibrio sp. JC047 TaxID=2683199 RepID=UPI0013D1BC7F|nr:FadR/GntR family transcriptional regulator [Pseudodesulfovibrio sp. JC047]NDV18203.1 FCD domain-containing protein [Pseudodesulfovibrio sp. JC047]
MGGKPKKDTSHRNQGRCEDVVATIKREILLKQYVPGDALLREELLAKRYGVSRTMVREALGVLKTQGYLESKRGKSGGTFVKNIIESSAMGNLFGDLILMGSMSINDLLAARLLIEPEGCRLAAMNASPRDLQKLEDIIQLVSTESDEIKKTEANVKFHIQIGKLSGNPFYEMSIRSFMSFTTMFTQKLGSAAVKIHNDSDHQKILDALKARDPQLVYEVMYVHVSGMKENMVSMEKMLRDAHLG